MSTSLLDQTPFEAPREPAAGVVAPARPCAERPAPGLTVLALGAGELAVAGYLLRHGEAVTLVDDPPDALVATSALAGVGYVPYDAANMRERREQVVERALSATVHAGFSARAVETVPGGGLVERLRALPRGSVSCVAVSSRSAREVRRVARAAGAPVLALRPGAAAAGGPAVVAATDATWSVPAAARALATEHVLLVTRTERARRRGAGPVPDRGITSTLRELDDATELSERHGLQPETALAVHPSRLGDKGAACEGLLVLCDTPTRRPPADLRTALRARRPVLFVPRPEAACDG